MTKKQAALTARLVVAIVATVLFAVATTYWHFWVALPNGLAPPPTVWQWCEAVRYAWLPLPPPAPPRAAIRIVDARQFNTMIYHYQHDRNPSRNITAVALLPWKYVAAGGATRSSVAENLEQLAEIVRAGGVNLGTTPAPLGTTGDHNTKLPLDRPDNVYDTVFTS